MSRRYNRRSSRPLEDLPSLFEAPAPDDTPFAVAAGAGDEAADIPAAGTASDDMVLDERYTGTAGSPRLMYMSFGSGSSGNCSYVGTGDCGILVDGGVDNNYVTERLLRCGIDMSTIHGILLTHDHADHVRYSYALLRRNPHMRLYATPRALEGLLRRHNLSRRIKDYHAPIYKEHEYRFGPLTVVPFETSHDGTDNAGYSITCGRTTLVVATDMGVVTPRADYYMRRATDLMIEANYDAAMLATGRYPEYLKSRIRSERGHMDNTATAAYLAEIHTPALRHIFLCHLSQDNNTPGIARETVAAALAARGIDVRDCPADLPAGAVYLHTLPRFEASDLYRL